MWQRMKPMNIDRSKRAAAEKAMEYVQPGMALGLGTGSTAAIFVEVLAQRVQAGLDVVCVPTSESTRLQAERAGLTLTTLDAQPRLDLTIDGADEIDAALRLIKGGGGALLREKIVATASSQMLVIADHSKRVDRLGKFALPVEVLSFGLEATRRQLVAQAADVGCAGSIELRRSNDGAPYWSDSGNYILDCAFGRIDEPEMLAAALQVIPGVVEHGLFIGLADLALIGDGDRVEVINALDEPDD